MAENRFDMLLRHALLDANWTEVRAVWEEAEKPGFSHAYLRWRGKLLADPFGFMKRKLRPAWIRALRMAACIVLACAVTLGTLMAVSPTVRAAVLNWLREISGNYMTYTSGQAAQTDALPSNWRVTWLPEGWELRDMTANIWIYWEADGEGSLTYGCYTPGSTDLTTNVDDVQDADTVRETVQVQRYRGDYYESEGYRVLLWENEEGFLFLLRGDSSLDRETFLKIAESVTYYNSPNFAYQLEWIPGEYAPMHRYELAGAVAEDWTYNRVSLIWRYVTDPVCAFVLPDGEPEEIAVGEFTGQYWAAAEPLEASDSASTITVGGVVVSVSGDPSAEQTGTLLWTDPNTNTTFLLEGALGRYDLVHMAESVVQTVPDPTPPSRHAALMEGTAGG
mgnify:CR=1 FL=1